MSKIKTDAEIEVLRESGKRLATVLQVVAREIKPGVTTKHLDEVAERLIRATGDTSPFLNYTPPRRTKALSGCALRIGKR